MDTITNYNIIRELNKESIEKAKSWYFEASNSLLVNITKAEAVRLEATYSSILVEPFKGSAFLKSRLAK